MKIVAEIFKLDGGIALPRLYALQDNGSVDLAVTNTALSLVAELPPFLLEELAQLLCSGPSAKISQNGDVPDWGINDKNLWIGLPRTSADSVLISNENIEAYSEEFGLPPRFTISFMENVIKYWLNYCSYVKSVGYENAAKNRMEMII